MAITTLDQLVNALGNNSSRIVLDKASLANQVAGRYCSMWTATGQPAQGANPTAAALCTNALTGAIQFAQQTSPATSYLAEMNAVCSNSACTLEIHDRIAHMGGLVLNSTALQTTNLPLDLEALSAPAERIGDANYGDVQTWLEVYAAGGATASNATVSVTFDDDTTANLTVIPVGGTLRQGWMLSVDFYRTALQQGKNIKRINSVQLSASTGTAGNFGFTFTRPRMYLPMGLANMSNKATWAETGLSEIANGACLQFMVLPSTTSSGTLRGGGKIAHG